MGMIETNISLGTKCQPTVEVILKDLILETYIINMKVVDNNTLQSEELIRGWIIIVNL
jgi:hypothetical protein